MALQSRGKRQRKSRKDSGHTYEVFENTQLWGTVETALEDLEKNCDLTLATRDEYVIGYICKALTEAGLIRTLPRQSR